MKPGASLEDSIAVTKELDLFLPPPNLFIPEDLSLKPPPAETQAVPLLVPSEPPVAAIFHRQDDVFGQPKAQVSFYIYSPYFTKAARRQRIKRTF